MAKVTFGPATLADLSAYYGDRPRETMRAIVVKLDGEPKGIIGLARETAHFRMFSEYKPEFEPYLKNMTTLRAIKAAMNWAAQSRMTVVAACQFSPRLLIRLGFVHWDGETYVLRKDHGMA